MSLSCYRVFLPTTNATNLVAQHGDSYIEVEGGYVHVIASSYIVVGREFPQAFGIERVGVGYDNWERCEAKEVLTNDV